jgi:hypothetical protein
MATLVINILPGKNDGDPARFVPTLQDPGPNGEAYASEGDIVSWFNATDQIHQPEAMTDGTFNTPVNAPRGSTLYLSDPIPGEKPARPGWTATQPAPAPANTLYYRCSQHHEEHGMIVVT